MGTAKKTRKFGAVSSRYPRVKLLSLPHILTWPGQTDHWAERCTAEEEPEQRRGRGQESRQGQRGRARSVCILSPLTQLPSSPPTHPPWIDILTLSQTSSILGALLPIQHCSRASLQVRTSPPQFSPLFPHQTNPSQHPHRYQLPLAHGAAKTAITRDADGHSVCQMYPLHHVLRDGRAGEARAAIPHRATDRARRALGAHPLRSQGHVC